ncbi:MAG: P1 family peptidase, partial [Calditrichaeota bacterium]|nr:P1 family peptidase [Calditrichota bacterium]
MRFLLAILIMVLGLNAQRMRFRDMGLKVGELATGKLNAITDVTGVKVGHHSVNSDLARTGVTAILAHDGNIFQDKVPAAIYIANGFGKLAGISQVEELGNIETPIILTNTLSVGRAVEAVVKYTLQLEGNEDVRSVNAIVGETNDGYLNDIRGMHVTDQHVFSAIHSAKTGLVEEGAVGAGNGTICFGFKGGIGTSSRLVRLRDGKTFTIGVLVQSNFGRS